jgi:Phosphotransferase enzyme family
VTPEAALAAVAERYGVALTDGGPCPGGEVGARYAAGVGGEAYVYKCVDGKDGGVAWARLVVDRVGQLRARGYPAPRYLAPMEVGDGGGGGGGGGTVVMVQERVAGSWGDTIDGALVERVRQLNDMQAGLGSGDGAQWSDFIALTLVEGADDYCQHDTLRGQGGEVAQLLSWIESIGASVSRLPADDLVHFDLHHRNILRTPSGDLTVVDWEGIRPGDRAFDLVTFCFGLSHGDGPDGVADSLWVRAEELTRREVLAAYVAHMALRRVDWTLRHHGADDLARLLPIVRRHVARVGGPGG